MVNGCGEQDGQREGGPGRTGHRGAELMDMAARKRMMDECARLCARGAVRMFTLLCTKVTKWACDDGFAAGVCGQWRMR